MTDLLAELLPCPFCGELPTIYDDDHPRGIVTWTVLCNNGKCPVEAFTTSISSKQEAIEIWNTRHHHAEIAHAVRDADRMRAYIKQHVPCTCHYSGRCGQRADGSYYGESSITHKCMRCELTDDAMRGGGE